MSLVSPPERSRSRCGYCKSHRGSEGKEETSVVTGMVARQLTVSDYQWLLERRWRRSGRFLYRPILEETCCALQSIRLRADSLILSRSLRKTLKRLCHHLGIKVPHSSPSSSSDSSYLDAVLESLDGCPRFSMKVVDPAGSASSQLIFDLYSRYQMSIHGDSEDDLGPRKFRLFLCDTPLIPEPLANGDLAYGSHHIYYHIDGQVVAVSVVDILPLCISDPNWAHLGLGTLSVLLEIALIRRLMKRRRAREHEVTNGNESAKRSVDALAYYYLGYYLPECAKLAYKARFQPSELLDPVTLRWMPMRVHGGAEQETA